MIVYLPFSEASFSTKSIIPTLKLPSLKLVEASFLKKTILTNATDFLAIGNHFLAFFQTAVKMEENGFH